jgi:hypothetical protein
MRGSRTATLASCLQGYAISEFLLHAKRWERLTLQEGQLAEDVRQALERTQRTHLLGT